MTTDHSPTQPAPVAARWISTRDAVIELAAIMIKRGAPSISRDAGEVYSRLLSGQLLPTPAGGETTRPIEWGGPHESWCALDTDHTGFCRPAREAVCECGHEKRLHYSRFKTHCACSDCDCLDYRPVAGAGEAMEWDQTTQPLIAESRTPVKGVSASSPVPSAAPREGETVERKDWWVVFNDAGGIDSISATEADAKARIERHVNVIFRHHWSVRHMLELRDGEWIGGDERVQWYSAQTELSALRAELAKTKTAHNAALLAVASQAAREIAAANAAHSIAEGELARRGEQNEETTTQCWRCKTEPGVVFDGTCYECIGCAGLGGKESREMLKAIDAAVREGLRAWPRIMDRVEFVRECIKLHREDAVRELQSIGAAGIEGVRGRVVNGDGNTQRVIFTEPNYTLRMGSAVLVTALPTPERTTP